METLTVNGIRDKYGWDEELEFECVDDGGGYIFTKGLKYKIIKGTGLEDNTSYCVGGSLSKFVLVEKPYPNPPHPHHNLIIEWAKGSTIQMLCSDGWRDIGHPPWSETHRQFRIKPDNPNAAKISEIESKMRELADELAELKEV